MEARDANLQYVVANSRFLIPPWVKVPHLASKLLGLCARQLPTDWQERYEAFSERARRIEAAE